MRVGPGGTQQGSSPMRYLAVAGVARAVCICEVLPIGVHLAVVGAAITAGAAGTCVGQVARTQLTRVGWTEQGKKAGSG